MKTATYEVEAKVAFIPSKKLNKKGKPQSIRVEIRKMYLRDPNAFLDSGKYRVFKKGDRFTISVIARTVQPWHTNPTGEPKVWYKEDESVDENGNRVYTRTNDPAMDENDLLKWLKRKLGDRATIALEDFLSMPAES